ncbi:AI-2E family transporter [Paracrocinitomix mangrovi]|uniref:AI-2E family transporter n=1 Tax=Paracrocinitomix mangrovi TaxID=2862509 RepID=UPI001C8D7411|nr:AI-2E family transporter [Paracrocinitomix mangrovi]UKN03832.1 AI-2E family transporter [Paracrocinitomix mangrovi]
MKLSLQNITYLLLSLSIVIVGLIVAKSVLVPLVFALIFTLALTPICNKLESWGFNTVLAIITTFISVTAIIGIVVTLFSVTFVDIYKELPEIQDKIDAGLVKIENSVNDITGLSDETLEDRIEENKSKILSPLWKFVEGSISSSLAVIGNSLLCLLYTFLLLYYRKGVLKILLNKLSASQKKDRTELLDQIQSVINSYFLGLVIVMLILGTINSLGLWIIGIDYPFFWGFLAGVLVVIPYIGTTLGGVLPFLYALATTDTMWQPIAIVIMYFTVQQIEGNFITPNIVGSKVQVNALTIIVGMIIGGMIWGIAGLILALPLIAILRTVFVRYEATEKLGLLMSEKVSEK